MARKIFDLQPKRKKIKGMPANQWLAKNEEILLHRREDGIVVKNICCSDVRVGNSEGKERPVPFAGTAILAPEGHIYIRIYGYVFILN